MKRTPKPLVLDFYTKSDCPLCDKALAVMERVFARLDDIPIELRFRDITTNPDWFEEYQWDIPVLELEGERLFLHYAHAYELERRLRAAWAARIEAASEETP